MDNTLLYVRSFDPGTRGFRYQVNPGFGAPPRGGGTQRLPFAISIQVRIVLGNDRVVSQFLREMRANGNQELAPERLRQYLAQQIPNVPAEAVALSAPARLYLTPAQVAALELAADSVATSRTALLNEFVETLTGAQRYSPRTQRRLVDLKARAVALRETATRVARSILTPAQWELLPATLRNPGTAFSPYPPQVITSGTSY